MNDLICILGTTATGKTKLAVKLAQQLNGAIISADSRQVYKSMDIGTGKDIDDYTVDGATLPYYLIDIRKAGEEYNLFQFQKDFEIAHKTIVNQNQTPILCGGSGMYIESIVNAYKLTEVPENNALREKLNEQDLEDLIALLKGMRTLHNTTDIRDKSRCIRAIEIEDYYQKNQEISPVKSYQSQVFGIRFPREIIRSRITQRLKYRLEHGMIEEVENILAQGVSHEKLQYYGLEYKFISLYLQGELDYNELFTKLNIAIHQFAKRQETWWRRMEKRGTPIQWLDGNWDEDQKVDAILKSIKNQGIR